MKPRTSTRSASPTPWAQSMIWETASSSPAETRAEATSMRSTRTASSRTLAMLSFSSGEKETPWVCSPSRSVVSRRRM